MSDFAAYTFYVNRPDLLVRAIDSFPDLCSQLRVVNNSGRPIVESPAGHRLSLVDADVMEPPVPLTYSQSMNWILKDAVAKGVNFILHFHSDAFSTNPNAVQELLACVRQYAAEGRRWGLAWTYYDILFAINPAAMLDIGGWDTELTDYFTDQDVRRRLKMSNWECIDTHVQGIDHEGSATINSDPKRKFLNQVTFPLRRAYYVAKHGGQPDKECHAFPFGNRELSWKP